MNVRIALLAGAALVGLASAPAVAQSQGPYLGIAGGASWIDDADITGAAPVTTLEFDTGWAALLKGGYSMGNLRPELELGIRDWDVDGANGGVAAGGDLKMYTVFANLNYDFMPNSNWSPYLGAGLGLARFSGDVNVGGTTGSAQDTTWAAQGIAGMWYALNNNWLLSADYRYQFGGDPDFGGAAGVGIEGDHSIHTVMLGLTYRFGAPAPAPQPAVAAPPPPPAPAPAAAAPAPAPRLPETYVVFFAFDRSEVSPVASQVLDRAIADFRATGMTNIVIEGHADRSGGDAYNQRLSQRRAQSVATYLRGKGIGQNAIQTAAFGETRPRVPTADGVRNDENRRAELFLRK